MPLNRYVVRVDPQGQTVTVDVLDTSGVSVVTYDSPQFAATARTLPLVITSQTDFWLHSPGPYDVSCKVGGAEVADAGTPKRVQVSDVPVLVVPDWERQRAATPGGSVSVDRLAVGVTPTVPSDLFTHAVDWTGATPDEQVGTSIAVSGANLHTTVDAVYAVTVRASFPTAAGNIRTLTVFDGNSVLPRFSTTVPPAAAGQSTIIETSFVYYLAGSPDTLTVWLTQDSGGDLAVDMYAAIQRLS